MIAVADILFKTLQSVILLIALFMSSLIGLLLVGAFVLYLVENWRTFWQSVKEGYGR